MFAAVKDICGKTADFLLPPRCPLCACRTGSHYSLCGGCFGRLAFVSDPRCHCCGVPFDYAVSGGEQLCGDCLRDRPAFDIAVAPLLYNDASRPALLRLKHGEALDLAPWLAKMMSRSLAEIGESWDVIVPVPLHRWRLWRRGFNQSAEIARHLSRLTGARHMPDALKRKRNTASQGGLSRKARFRNLVGAFEPGPAAKQELAGKRVLLVDDVLTTGATAQACARVIRKAGASRIGVAAAARVHHIFSDGPDDFPQDGLW